VQEEAEAEAVQDATVDHGQEGETQESIEDMQRRLLEDGKVMLAAAKNMREVSDLRKEISENLTGPDLHTWEKLCDERSRAVLQATAKKPAQPGGRR
jgi:hypothetical protein